MKLKSLLMVFLVSTNAYANYYEGNETTGGIFYIDNPAIGTDPNLYNACRKDGVAGTSLYDTASTNQMMMVNFSVASYGAKGLGESDRINTTSPNCSTCTSAANAMISDLATEALTNPTAAAGGAGYRENDEWDWVGIQSALYAAHKAGGGTVLIPDTGSDYILSRALWVYSNTRLYWMTDSSKTVHSRVKLKAGVKTFAVGTVIGTWNPYDLAAIPAGGETGAPLIAKAARHFRCKVYFKDPRVAATIGENGVSAAKGAYDVRLFGGEISGAKWGSQNDVDNGYNPQGGRAVQMESGVQQVAIDGTFVSDSTMGFSNSAGLYYANVSRSNQARYLNAADKISIKNVKLINVEAPFLFSHLGHFKMGTSEEAAMLSAAPMSVAVANFEARNSGRLTSEIDGAFTHEPVNQQTGILNFIGGMNVLVTTALGGENKVNSSQQTYLLSSLVRGFGHNNLIEKVKLQEGVANLVNFTQPLAKKYSSGHAVDFRVRNIDTEVGVSVGSYAFFPDPKYQIMNQSQDFTFANIALKNTPVKAFVHFNASLTQANIISIYGIALTGNTVNGLPYSP